MINERVERLSRLNIETCSLRNPIYSTDSQKCRQTDVCVHDADEVDIQKYRRLTENYREVFDFDVHELFRKYVALV